MHALDMQIENKIGLFQKTGTVKKNRPPGWKVRESRPVKILKVHRK